MNFTLGHCKRLLWTSEIIFISVIVMFNSIIASANGEISQQKFFLPDLATRAAEQEESQRLNALANMTLKAGKAIQNNTQQLGFSDSTQQWLFDQISSRLTHQLALQGLNLLEDYGQPQLALKSDIEHHFVGSTGSLFKPLLDKPDNLFFSQFNLNETDPGLLASVGLGRRWSDKNWIFGYNAFVDHLFTDDQNRATFGSELWSDYLLVSVNYLNPLNNWHINDINHNQLMSRGFNLNTRGTLPFYRPISFSLGWQYYLDDDISDLKGNLDHPSPQSVELGLIYHPMPLLTLRVLHIKHFGGEYQNQLGLQLHYQFGVDFAEQLSFDAANDVNKYALNYYVEANRYAVPDFK